MELFLSFWVNIRRYQILLRSLLSAIVRPTDARWGVFVYFGTLFRFSNVGEGESKLAVTQRFAIECQTPARGVKA